MPHAFTIAAMRLAALTLTLCAGVALGEDALQYGYTAREPDASGVAYYRSRPYDPRTGRFLQRDRIGLAGGINDYAYVDANPINAADPDGTDPKTPEERGFWATFASYFVFGGRSGEQRFRGALQEANIGTVQINAIEGNLGEGVAIGAATFAGAYWGLGWLGIGTTAGVGTAAAEMSQTQQEFVYDLPRYVLRADRRTLGEITKAGEMEAGIRRALSLWYGESALTPGREVNYVSTTMDPRHALSVATKVFVDGRERVPVYTIDLGNLTAAWARTAINLGQHLAMTGQPPDREQEILFERIPISAIVGFRMGVLTERINGQWKLGPFLIGPFHRNPAYIPPP